MIDRRVLSRRSNDAAERLKTIAARSNRPVTSDEPEAAIKTGKPGRSDYLAVKAALQERLLDEIGERGLLESDGADVAAAVQEFAARAIESSRATLDAKHPTTMRPVKRLNKSIRLSRTSASEPASPSVSTLV